MHSEATAVMDKLDAINRMIERHGPDAICTALAPMLTPGRIARIDAVLTNRLVSVTVGVEDTYDPHNAAAAMRTAEGLGLHELHVIEPELRFSAAKGVTRGAHKWIDLRRWPNAVGAVAALHARGFAVYATRPDASQSIAEASVARPIAVMFGNEHGGLSPQALAACDGALAVPMYGFTESYNLSVTVALVASTLASRRRAHLGANGDLPAELRARLRARWFALGIRGVVGVLERSLARPVDEAGR